MYPGKFATVCALHPISATASLKTYDFGLQILKLYVELRKKKVDIGLCSQLLRSSTSVGANAEEAMGGSTRRDFVYRLQISYREAREARYWLRLLKDSAILEKELALSLISDCEEITRILTAILKSSKIKA